MEELIGVAGDGTGPTPCNLISLVSSVLFSRCRCSNFVSRRCRNHVPCCVDGVRGEYAVVVGSGAAPPVAAAQLPGAAASECLSCVLRMFVVDGHTAGVCVCNIADV